MAEEPAEPEKVDIIVESEDTSEAMINQPPPEFTEQPSEDEEEFPLSVDVLEEEAKDAELEFYCGKCEKECKHRLNEIPAKKGWLFCGACFLLGLWCGLCLLPLCKWTQVKLYCCSCNWAAEMTDDQKEDVNRVFQRSQSEKRSTVPNVPQPGFKQIRKIVSAPSIKYSQDN